MDNARYPILGGSLGQALASCRCDVLPRLLLVATAAAECFPTVNSRN